MKFSIVLHFFWPPPNWRMTPIKQDYDLPLISWRYGLLTKKLDGTHETAYEMPVSALASRPHRDSDEVEIVDEEG